MPVRVGHLARQAPLRAPSARIHRFTRVVALHARSSAVRVPRLVIAVALIGAVLAACGDSDDTAAGVDTASSEAPSTDEWTPVTIEHTFGETEIADEPERVVVAGLNEADYLYSLGVAPVGVHEWWGGYPYATGPWADPVREELGAEPEVLDGFDVSVEWVASLDPDLIVVTYHDIDRATYDLLSGIAPVVANPDGYEVWSAPWRVQLRLIADAVGRRDRAEEVIADVDATIEQIKQDYPHLAGARFDTGGFNDAGGLDTYSSGDVVNQVLAELGMVVPAEYDEMAEGVYVRLSEERFDLLDLLDTFVWLDAEGTMREGAEQLPTYTTTRLHTEGRAIFPERDLVLAMSFNTPLSIPYFLTELAPMLDAALDGDPSTVVS